LEAAVLLDPTTYDPQHLDERSRQQLRAVIEFFESRGLARLKDDDHNDRWYPEFLDMIRRESVFADFATPAGEGAPTARWDTARIVELNEVLAFYSLAHWYAWQVSVLGLGPIWMSDNAAARQRAADLLQKGAVFGFGLSERAHGADVYATDMVLTPDGAGGWRANGSKYYIGNGNVAGLLSVFGRFADTDEYVFFLVEPNHPDYELVQNVVASQMYVAEFHLADYPVTEADILHRGSAAMDAALNTVNVGKFNLGWASIGICEHAFHEALAHAAHRHLYGATVTDFPHVQRMLTDAYVRLAAMKLFARRATDYLRTASPEDRRYLLYNPITKMKVTSEGERVIDLLWEVIAARGFEKDTYFSAAARDIRALPKLEGTVHVNLALVLKFLGGYFFDQADYPEVPQRLDAGDDAFLFRQGPARGLGAIRFHDHAPAFARYAHLPNVAVFTEQVATFRDLVVKAAPDEQQRRDLDLLMTFGQLFTLVVYAQLVLEEAALAGADDDLIDQVFDVFVRDAAAYAVELHGKASATDAQQHLAQQLVRRPVHDAGRYARVYAEVMAWDGRYTMRP
jgi:alkylation response protein AidB-like acyl-CoA dehydrogenase